MEELDLKELFNIFWKSKLQIIFIVLIFIAIGVVYTTNFVTPMYTAKTTLVLATSEDNNGKEKSKETTGTSADTKISATDVTMNSKLVSTYREIVRSSNVIRRVISNLNIDIKENDLKNNVTVSNEKDTELIKIEVTNVNPENAKKIANEIANVFTDIIGEIYNINNVHIVDEAETPNTPSNVNHIKDILIFAVVGLVISVVYILIVNMLDNTIKSADDVEQNMKISVLATIPVYSGTDIEKRKKSRKK